mgnify:CR=1 FL=1
MWTDEWPTEPGYYWFYGWKYGKTFAAIDKPIVVTFRNTSNGFRCDDSSMEDEAVGMWQRIAPPAVPTPDQGADHAAG